MNSPKIYFNTRCSKCHQALALLDEKNMNPDVIEYLNKPLSIQDLTNIISLGIPTKDLIRTGEDEWKNTGLDIETASDDDLINAIITSSILLQRPIVIANGKAAIGRPPENILEII